MVEQLFLAVPRGCLRFVIVVFPDNTHLLFLDPAYIVYPQNKSGLSARPPKIFVTLATSKNIPILHID